MHVHLLTVGALVFGVAVVVLLNIGLRRRRRVRREDEGRFSEPIDSSTAASGRGRPVEDLDRANQLENE